MSEAGGYLCPQRMSDGASLREEKVCPDCPLTKNRPERGLERLLELSTMFNRSTYRRGHASSGEHEGCEAMPCERAGKVW